MEIGYDSQLQVAEDGYYPVALMPAKKPRLDQTQTQEDHSSLSITANLPTDRLQSVRFDNRMKEIEHMVKEISKKSD